jgi:hypothetical protein
MDPILAAFLARSPDDLARTLRFQRLDRLDRYYEGTQYAARQLDAQGYWKNAPDLYGSLVGTPAWNRRDPGAVWNLVGQGVRELTDWTLAGDNWCSLAVTGDDEATAWLQAVATAANLSEAMIEARNYGGAMGTAVVSFAIRDGEVFFEAHNPKHCWPLAWRDPARHRPAVLAMVYRGDNPFAEHEQEHPWVARVWDEMAETHYQRVRGQQEQWVWQETSRVVHGLGFCPAYWYPQNARDGRHEGVPDAEGAEGEVDEANELWASGGATTKRNADDTLVIKDDPRLNPGNVKKGAFNTIWAKGGAEYLSQDGASAKVCVELSEKRAQHVWQRMGVVMADLETLGKATTGEALKKIFQRTVNTAGRRRTGYTRGLIVPLCEGLLRAGRLLERRGLGLRLPPREVKQDTALKVSVEVPYRPGTGEFVAVTWPAPFPPSLDDITKQITAARTATGDRQVMARETAVKWLATSPLPITNAEEELKKIEEDEDAAAERAAASIGMGAEPEGKAGPVGDKDESEDEGDDAQEDKNAGGTKAA